MMLGLDINGLDINAQYNYKWTKRSDITKLLRCVFIAKLSCRVFLTKFFQRSSKKLLRFFHQTIEI